MGSKKPDRAMELLRAHIHRKFVIAPSDLSPAEIVSRQGRAEADNLTVQERGGSLPLTQCGNGLRPTWLCLLPLG